MSFSTDTVDIVPRNTDHVIITKRMLFARPDNDLWRYTCIAMRGAGIINTPLLQNGPVGAHTFSNKASGSAAAAAPTIVSYNFLDKLQVRLIMRSISVIRLRMREHSSATVYAA